MQIIATDYKGPSKVKVGGADIWEVEEVWHKKAVSDMTTDQQIISSLPQWMFPDFIDADWNFDIVSRCWVLMVDDKIAVIDPCTGNGRNYPEFPVAHMLDTPFIERFAATGIRPEDVDFVFCTHLHMDHCGWNTVLRDGRYVPTFPNARYVMVQREFDRWDTRRPDHVAIPANAGTFENSVLPVLEAGLAEIIDGTYDITPSLQVQPAYGHTIGHSMLHLCSEANDAYFVGDVFHHPIEILHPDLDDNTAEDPLQLAATRKQIIDLGLKKNALIIAAHFSCPFGGWLRQGSDGIVFEAFAAANATSAA